MIRTAIFLALSAVPAYSMDDVTILGIYSVDKAVCGLYVPQSLIDRGIGRASAQYRVSEDQVIIAAASIGTDIERDLRMSGRTKEYCEGRRLK